MTMRKVRPTLTQSYETVMGNSSYSTLLAQVSPHTAHREDLRESGVSVGHPMLTQPHEIVSVGRPMVTQSHETVSIGHPMVTQSHETVSIGRPMVTQSHETVSIGRPMLTQSYETVSIRTC